MCSRDVLLDPAASSISSSGVSNFTRPISRDVKFDGRNAVEVHFLTVRGIAFRTRMGGSSPGGNGTTGPAGNGS